LLAPAGACATRPAFLTVIDPADGWDVPWSMPSVTSEPASAAATIHPAVRLVTAPPTAAAVFAAPALRGRSGSVSGPALFPLGAGVSCPADSSYSLTSAPSLICLPHAGGRASALS
jgi:hypothetical protein